MFNAIYPSRLLQCELNEFGDIGCGDVCFLMNIIKLGNTDLVVLKASKHVVNSTLTSPSRNHNQITQDNRQTSL